MSIHYLGENHYQVRVRGRKRPDGTRPSVTKTVHGTETAAKRVERDLLTQRDRGTLHGRAMKLRDYADVWYAESIRHGAPKTHELNAYLLDVHITKRLGDLRLDAITAKHIRDFYADIGETLSGTSARKVSNLLTQILDQAVIDEQIARNPCRLVRKQDRPKVDTEEREALDAAGAHGLLEALGKTERGQLVQTVAAFMLGTGARPGEAMALRWAEVDLGAAVVHIRKSLEKATGARPRRKDVKNRKRGLRDVPLPDALVITLTAHRAAQRRLRLKTKNWRDQGYVFPSTDPRHAPGGPWTVGALRQAWRKALKGTAYERFTPYVCRHTYATRLRDVIPDEELSRLMGHSAAVLRGTYSHVRPETMQQARELIAGLL